MAKDIVIEDVPRFVKRPGDQVIEGSNNTIIILESDRAKKGPASRDDGVDGPGAGSIHVIAGREAGDPDFTKDSAFLYLSKKTKVDTNLGLTGVESTTDEKPSAVLKSDAIRIVGRKDMKLCANDDEKHYMFLDGKKIKIKIGDNTIEMTEGNAVVKVGEITISVNEASNVVKVNSKVVQLAGGCEKPWDSLFESMISFMKNHNHLSAVGPTGPGLAGPAGVADLSQMSANKVKWDAHVKNGAG